ncbi:MAG: oligosaccharide flippase family protein [Anaerolineae bacterium]|nr:oligosaccharide flippase family protein [Anaerolineae bacterium]
MRGRLSTHTITLAVSNVGTAGLSFLLAALIGRALGAEGLGIYGVALAWVMPLALGVEFGLGTLLTREIAQDEARRGDLVRAAVRARQIMGGGMTLLLIVAAPSLSTDPLTAIGLQISAPLVLIQPLFSTYTAVFRARGDMRPIPWLNIGMLVVQLPLTALALLTEPSADMSARLLLVFLINTLTSAGQLGAAWWIYRARHYAPPSGRRMAVLPLLRASGHFGLAAVFFAAQMRLSFILLESLAGADAAGYFAAANRFSEAARLLPNAFFGALFPALSALAADPQRLRATFRRALLGLLGYGVLAGAALALFAPLLIELVFGADFTPAVPALQWLGLALAFGLLRGGRTLDGYARGREARVNLVNGAAVVVQFAASAWLIERAGAVGAAQALALVEALAFIALMIGLGGDQPRGRTG